MKSELDDGQSMSSLLKGIARDLRSLIEDEVALARLEIREQATRARTAAVSLAGAIVALTVAGAFALVAGALGIAALLGWPTWAGFVAVAALMSLVGFVTLATARRKLRAVQIVPEKTVATLKENAEWISKRLSSARR